MRHPHAREKRKRERAYRTNGGLIEMPNSMPIPLGRQRRSNLYFCIPKCSPMSLIVGVDKNDASGGFRSNRGRGLCEGGQRADTSSTGPTLNEEHGRAADQDGEDKGFDLAASNYAFKRAAPPPVVTKAVPDVPILFQGWVVDERREDSKVKRCVETISCFEAIYLNDPSQSMSLLSGHLCVLLIASLHTIPGFLC